MPVALRLFNVVCTTMISKHFLHIAAVMPDHVHLIFTPLVNSGKREIYSLAEIMGGIKGALAQLINRKLGRSGKVWQTESLDRVLRSSESPDSKAAYILENPVRVGLVGRPERLRLEMEAVRQAYLRRGLAASLRLAGQPRRLSLT
jgi:REP element-mobilizing transposase RayT